MATNRQHIRQNIQDFNFKQLFVNELGWDHLNEPPLTIPCEGQTYTLRPLVEKRGVKVYVCDPDAQSRIPADPILRKIEREVTRHAYEHFIIYVDAAKQRQVWQWVKREQGKPLTPRLNRFYKGQSGGVACSETRGAGCQHCRRRQAAYGRGGRASSESF